MLTYMHIYIHILFDVSVFLNIYIYIYTHEYKYIYDISNQFMTRGAVETIASRGGPPRIFRRSSADPPLSE